MYRSMREDPQPHRPDTEKSFRGDNFVRKNGDFAVRCRPAWPLPGVEPQLQCPAPTTLPEA